jgi:hypothetical protein
MGLNLNWQANRQSVEKGKETFLKNYHGSPSNFWETLFLQKGYFDIMVVLGLIGCYNLISKRRVVNWFKFFSFLLFSTVFNYTWGIYNANLVTTGPAWVFLDGGWTGIEWLITLDDSIFYVVCEICFYFLFFAIKGSDSHLNDWRRGQIVTKSLHVLLGVVSFFILGQCGISVTVLFLIPAAILSLSTKINIKHYWLLFLYCIFFSTAWDYAATTWIRALTGHGWAAQWVYNPDPALFVKSWEWLWGWNSPASITPWYSIAGIYFNYMLLAFLDNLARPMKQ